MRKGIDGSKRGVYFSYTKAATSMPASRDVISEFSIVSPSYEWISASDEDHHDHSPVFAVQSLNLPLLGRKEAELRYNGAICEGNKNEHHFNDVKKAQRQMLVRTIVNDRNTFMPMNLCDEDYTPTIKSHHLITDIHIIINRHRMKLNILPLIREKGLDEIAFKQAKHSADKKGKKHSNLRKLILEIQDYTTAPIRRIGENICGGTSVDKIFEKIMNDPIYVADRNNIFDRRFSSFGVGVATSSSGKIYICQVFKG